MSISLNDIITYGNAKFKVVKPATTEDIRNIQNQLNEKIDINNDFTIIYPNGGTAQNPANISPNSKYVENNPFLGYYVDCKLEIFYKNQWFKNNAYHNTEGARVEQIDDTIIIQTGSGYIKSNAALDVMYWTEASTSSFPARVKVWKIGKIN